MYKSIKSTVIVVSLSLMLFGCVEHKNINNDFALETVTSNERSITNREELTNILVNNLVLDKYLSMFVKVTDSPGNLYSACAATNDTYRKLKLKYHDEITLKIDSLNNAEVIEYLSLLKSDDELVFQRFHELLYPTDIYNYVEINESTYTGIAFFFNSLSEDEFDILFSVDHLPNTDVRDSLFLVSGNNFNVTLSQQYLDHLAKNLESICL